MAVAATRKEEGALRREHRKLTRQEWAAITSSRQVVRRFPTSGRLGVDRRLVAGAERGTPATLAPGGG